MLAGDWRKVGRKPERFQEASGGLVVEDAGSGYCGAVIRVERTTVELEDRLGHTRTFRLGSGFLIDGKPVTLTAPNPAGRPKRTRTASGSFGVADARARVARPSRIFVEGRHDAELVERVWGDDLRIEGVVVEYIEGVDELDAALGAFAPGKDRRIGVLVDHLVPGSKESRIAEQVVRGPLAKHVLIVGHPFIDVWQAVKPDRLGLVRWPQVPRSIEWKRGICQALGWPGETQTDIANAWKRILGQVHSYADLEPELLGCVERLIDFVTE